MQPLQFRMNRNSILLQDDLPYHISSEMSSHDFLMRSDFGVGFRGHSGHDEAVLLSFKPRVIR